MYYCELVCTKISISCFLIGLPWFFNWHPQRDAASYHAWKFADQSFSRVRQRIPSVGQRICHQIFRIEWRQKDVSQVGQNFARGTWSCPSHLATAAVVWKTHVDLKTIESKDGQVTCEPWHFELGVSLDWITRSVYCKINCITLNLSRYNTVFVWYRYN